MTEADKVREVLHEQTSYLIAQITQLTAERDTFRDLAEIANGQALDARANEKHLRAAMEKINHWCNQGDVNIQPLLVPIQEQAQAALAVLAQEDEGND